MDDKIKKGFERITEYLQNENNLCRCRHFKVRCSYCRRNEKIIRKIEAMFNKEPIDHNSYCVLQLIKEHLEAQYYKHEEKYEIKDILHMILIDRLLTRIEIAEKDSINE